MTHPFDTLEKYHVPMVMHHQRVLPMSYLSRRCLSQASYRNDRMGASNALKKILQTLIERGDLQEIPRNECVTKFKTTARCFMVSNPQAFSFS
jgi:hypothetical protein